MAARGPVKTVPLPLLAFLQEELLTGLFSGGLVPEGLTGNTKCIAFFFPPPSKRSFYGQTHACLLLKKIPLEELTSLDLGKAAGDPSEKGRLSKQLCLPGLSGSEDKHSFQPERTRP